MRLLYLLALGLMFTACNDMDDDNGETTTTNPNRGGDSTSLVAVIDSLHAAFKAKSLEQMNAHFAEQGTFVGTDPNEFWTRQQLNDYLSVAFKSTTESYNYTVSKRVTRLSDNGKSGIVIDQFTLPFSPNLPIRSIAYAEHRNGKWSIKMFSWNFIANNSDVDKLNAAIKPTAQAEKPKDTTKVPDAYTEMIR